MDARSEAAYRELKRLIVSGAFGMGEKISEERMARRLGTSRTPVRTALNRLEIEGFVTYEPRRGHRTRQYTEADVRDIYACRAILEAEAIKEVASRGLSADQAASLERIVARMESLLDESAASGTYGPEMRDGFRRMNNEFHALLYSLVENRVLRTLINQTTDLPVAIRTYANFTPAQLHESHLTHKRILAAILARDPLRADALMREHVWSARDRILQAGGPRPEAGRRAGLHRKARRRPAGGLAGLHSTT